MPLFYGRWSAAAEEFADTDGAQRSPEATAGFAVPGAFGDPAQTQAALASVTAPVLLVGDELDPAPTVRLLHEFAALFRRAVIQPDAGHVPWIRPDGVRQDNSGFPGHGLEKVSSPSNSAPNMKLKTVHYEPSCKSHHLNMLLMRMRSSCAPCGFRTPSEQRNRGHNARRQRE